MADFLGCEADEIVFGSNMTTMTFALSRALGQELHARDEIVLTRQDHDANITPSLALEEQGVVIRLVDIDPKDCTLDIADLRGQFNDRIRLVALCYASNERRLKAVPFARRCIQCQEKTEAIEQLDQTKSRSQI